VESVKDMGTTFTLALPAVQEQVPKPKADGVMMIG
jgi:hypothetical protein